MRRLASALATLGVIIVLAGAVYVGIALFIVVGSVLLACTLLGGGRRR